VVSPAERNARVNAIWASLKGTLLRRLETAEREAFSGDCVELAMTDPEIVQSLLNLIARRQLKAWEAWDPWIALILCVVPICPLLASQSFALGNGIWPCVELWLDHGIRYEDGLTLVAQSMGFLFSGAALITWSWGAGFVFSRVSQRTIWVSAGLFVGIYLGSALVREPYFYGDLWSASRALLPLLIGTSFVLIPACLGILSGKRLNHRKFLWTMLFAAWTTIIGALSLWSSAWDQAAMDNWSHGAPALTLSQLAQYPVLSSVSARNVVVMLMLSAPFAFLVAKDAWFNRREHHR
jgi:hypothetical protein